MAANDLPPLQNHGLGVQQAVRTLRMAAYGPRDQYATGRMVVNAKSTGQGHGSNRSLLARSVGT